MGKEVNLWKEYLSNFNFPFNNSDAIPFDAKDTGYGISGLHKAACFAAIYKTFPNSISRNVKPHQKVMHTALKEVNGIKPKIFSFLPESFLKVKPGKKKKKSKENAPDKKSKCLIQS